MFRVLLVDDEIFFRQGLREIVDWESSGFKVIGEADNGEDALAFIFEHKPDLVITDIRMPVCDGLELIDHVVNKHKLPTKFIIVSGYDEFRYAQQAVKFGVSDFLLKPIDEINLQETLDVLNKTLTNEKQVEDSRVLYENEEMMYELLSQEWNDEQLVMKYEQLGFLTQEDYTFIFIEMNDYPHIKANERYKNQIIKVLQDTICTIIPELTKRSVYPMRGKLAILINHKWIPKHSSMHVITKQLVKSITEQLKMKVLLYVGTKATGLYFFEDAYRSALLTAQYKYLDNRNVYFASQLEESVDREDYSVISSDHYKQLLIEVEQGNETTISEEVLKLFSMFSEKRYTLEQMKATLNKLVAETLQTMQTMHIDCKSVDYLNDVLQIENYNVVREELISIVNQYVIELARVIAVERKEMARGGIQRVKKYIDTNYSENISLKTIANKFYINPVYLGQLFKKTYDVYFNDYLLQVRIQEAKKMLRQTDLRIYEVAEKVGFNHAEYFVAQFEKIEKLSPTAYRQTFTQDIGEAK